MILVWKSQSASVLELSADAVSKVATNTSPIAIAIIGSTQIKPINSGIVPTMQSSTAIRSSPK
jgi:hypothetical protein